MIDIYSYSDIVVLGNGDYPQAQLPLDIIGGHRVMVVCDGAANAYLATPRKFDVIIGDGDSMSQTIKDAYADKIVIDHDQETNDQTKAVKYLADRGYDDISIVGASGRREDHLFGNVSLLVDYLKNGVKARIYTDHGVFIPLCGDAEVVCRRGQQMSIFNFGCTRLSAEGLQYAIRPFVSMWEGTLNRVVEEKVIFSADSYYMVYIAY
ncbi:MAG: thiamine diphosphokinase [Muribaculaceae bacterium]|nr:thiamine diphosphokinase [Muribaculaceae bacterium]